MSPSTQFLIGFALLIISGGILLPYTFATESLYYGIPMIICFIAGVYLTANGITTEDKELKK